MLGERLPINFASSKPRQNLTVLPSFRVKESQPNAVYWQKDSNFDQDETEHIESQVRISSLWVNFCKWQITLGRGWRNCCYFFTESLFPPPEADLQRARDTKSARRSVASVSFGLTAPFILLSHTAYPYVQGSEWFGTGHPNQKPCWGPTAGSSLHFLCWIQGAQIPGWHFWLPWTSLGCCNKSHHHYVSDINPARNTQVREEGCSMFWFLSFFFLFFWQTLVVPIPIEAERKSTWCHRGQFLTNVSIILYTVWMTEAPLWESAECFSLGPR